MVLRLARVSLLSQRRHDILSPVRPGASQPRGTLLTPLPGALRPIMGRTQRTTGWGSPDRGIALQPGIREKDSEVLTRMGLYVQGSKVAALRLHDSPRSPDTPSFLLPEPHERTYSRV